MKTHKIIVDPATWSGVFAGTIPFLLRPCSVEFDAGDRITVREQQYPQGHTHRVQTVEVIYTFYGPYGGLAHGWVILGIKRIED